MNRRSFLAGASALIATPRLNKAWVPTSRSLVFMGTRGDAKKQGIYVSIFDSAAGTVTPVTSVSDIPAATAFAYSPNKRYLYSTSEVGNDGKSDGGLFSFEIDHSTGALKQLNTVPSHGGGPTSILIDATGKTAFVACFGSGVTNSFKVLPDGKLGDLVSSMKHTGTGPHRRQAAPHAHGVVHSPDNRFVYSADLGADRVFIFKFNAATGALTPNDPPFAQLPPGSGPRQLAFHPSGKFLYLLNELVARVTVFACDPKTGALGGMQTVSAIPIDTTGEPSGAGILMRPDGKFLYTTTRNDNSAEMFTVNKSDGTLELKQRVSSGGKTPWAAALDHSGEHLLSANLDSNTVQIFKTNPTNGELTPLTTIPNVPSVASVIAVPA